jgi:hypothetical protein
MEFLLICGVTMEMVLNYDGARFLGCFMLYFYFFIFIFSWSMDALGGLDGALLRRLRNNWSNLR